MYIGNLLPQADETSENSASALSSMTMAELDGMAKLREYTVFGLGKGNHASYIQKYIEETPAHGHREVLYNTANLDVGQE